MEVVIKKIFFFSNIFSIFFSNQLIDFTIYNIDEKKITLYNEEFQINTDHIHIIDINKAINSIGIILGS